MGYAGLNLGFGLQRLVDAQQRYTQNSRSPVSLRMRNFTPVQNELYAQLGYTIEPASGATGTTDIQISPPPMTRLISMHNIGMSQGKLRFGAREFVISGSFVDAQQLALGLARPELVWFNPAVVGLVAYSLLFTIEQFVPEEIGGKSVLWTLTCNANEVK